MEQVKKLQNFFNVFLPMNYRDFRLSQSSLTSNQAVVAELIRICCEEEDVKAIQMAFERILGKPEKVVVIKRTTVRTYFPDAKTKESKAIISDRVMDEFKPAPVTQNKVVITAENAPGILLMAKIDAIGNTEREYSYSVLDDKDSYEVAEVMAANLYGIAMRGSNLGAIKLLFDYLDGAVADVVRLDGENTIVLESWADVAPYEALPGEDGIWYVEQEAVE